MTPEEFYLAVDGYQARLDREMHRAAWMAAAIISGWGKPPKVEQLLGPEFMQRQRRRQQVGRSAPPPDEE